MLFVNSVIKSINSNLSKYLSLCVGLALMGCEGDHQPLSTDLPVYHGLGQMPLNVAMIRHQQLPQDPPSLKMPLFVTVEKALQDWEAQRLVPSAPDGIAVIILRRYDLREIPIIPQGSFLTRWTEYERERLESSLEVEIEFYDAKNIHTDSILSQVSHSRGFEAELTPRERQAAWRKEITELMEALDLDLRERLKPYLNPKALKKANKPAD